MLATITLVLGGLVTWYCSKVYYEKAAKDLKNEANELRRLINMILTALERKGIAKLNKDSNGNILGFSFEEGSHIEFRPMAASETTFKKEE